MAGPGAPARSPDQFEMAQGIMVSVLLQGPLMLEMNVLPDVAAATSATMILFTSLVGSLVFISFGAIE